MRNPDLYYQKCLQGLCYFLACNEDMGLALELSGEIDVEKLVFKRN